MFNKFFYFFFFNNKLYNLHFNGKELLFISNIINDEIIVKKFAFLNINYKF